MSTTTAGKDEPSSNEEAARLIGGLALLVGSTFIEWWVWNNVAVAMYGAPDVSLWHIVGATVLLSLLTSNPPQERVDTKAMAVRAAMWLMVFWVFWMGS